MTAPARQATDTSGGHTIGAPWRRSAFWLLQLVVLALFLVRLATAVAFHLRSGSIATEYTIAPLFLVPVVYAALDFGFVGALVTSGTVAVLSLPQIVLSATGGDRTSAAVQVAQVAILAATAALVGQWVTSERRARLIAENAREDHERTEHLYRELFTSNLSPILIVDFEGRVVDMNPAAHRFFDPQRTEQPDGGLPRIVDVVGAEAARIVLTELVAPADTSGRDEGSGDDLVIVPTDAGPLLLRPTATRLRRAGVDEGLQVVFSDVTAETLRRQRTEAYAAYVLEGLEDERRHIAQELHDGPVQALIHLCRQIDAAAGSESPVPQRSGRHHPPDRSGEPTGSVDPGSLAELRDIAESTVAELRGIARGLRPPVLDDLGLAASIRQLVSDVSDRSGLVGTFEVIGRERRLPPGVELTLFRITQEAVANIERHAHASAFNVELNLAETDLTLIIRDDGVGFSPGDAGRRTGDASMGLAGMSERARLVGGSLQVISRPGQGCLIRVQKALQHNGNDHK